MSKTVKRQRVKRLSGTNEQNLKSASGLVFLGAIIIAIPLIPFAIYGILQRELFLQGEGGGPTKAQIFFRKATRKQTRFTNSSNLRGWTWID